MIRLASECSSQTIHGLCSSKTFFAPRRTPISAPFTSHLIASDAATFLALSSARRTRPLCLSRPHLLQRIFQHRDSRHSHNPDFHGSSQRGIRMCPGPFRIKHNFYPIIGKPFSFAPIPLRPVPSISASPLLDSATPRFERRHSLACVVFGEGLGPQTGEALMWPSRPAAEKEER